MSKLEESNGAMHFPCSHCGHAKNDCKQEVGGKTCHYEPCTKEELMKRILIAQKFVESESEQNELYEMRFVFETMHNGYAYDMHHYMLYHRVCNECDGSGIGINSHTVGECKHCGGVGIVDCEPRTSHYTTLWFIFERCIGKKDVSTEDLRYLYTTKEEATKIAKNNERKRHAGSHWEVGELLVSKNIIDLNDGTDIGDNGSLYKIINTEDALAKILVLNETTNSEYKITGFGSWSELHSSTFGSIAPYQDIERLSSGHTILIRMDKFNQMMSVKTNESVNALYWNLLMNTIMVYCNTYVTYSGADKLITKYVGSKGFCRDWTSLRSNVLKHVTTDNAGKVTNNDGKKLAEMVQEDFRQYGILLPIIDAFGIIEKLVSIMGEENMTLNIATRRCDALVVFIIEYICISPDAEFNNITNASDDYIKHLAGTNDH